MRGHNGIECESTAVHRWSFGNNPTCQFIALNRRIVKMAKKKNVWTFGKDLFGKPKRTNKKTKRTETLDGGLGGFFTGRRRWKL
jgi:hypothetical protein